MVKTALPILESAEARRLFFKYHSVVPLPLDAEERAFVSTGEKIPVAYDQPIAVHTFGSGPAVLFIHGFFGKGAQFRRIVPAIVDAGFRAVICDLPGHGDSPGHFGFGELMAVVMDLIRQRVGPLHGIVTHSVGSLWAMIGLCSGLEAKSLACINSVADTRYFFDVFLSAERAEPSVAARLVELIDAFYGRPNVLDSWSPVNMVSDLRMPALVVHGTGDSVIPVAHGQRLASAWPGSSFVRVEGAGHLDVLGHPTAISAVVDFISRHGR